MIFVAVGTQMFQFNRMLSLLDEAVKVEMICDKIVAQIGNSTYIPKIMNM